MKVKAVINDPLDPLERKILRLARQVYETDPPRDASTAIKFEYYDGRYRIRERDEAVPLITIAHNGNYNQAKRALKAALEVMAGPKR